jgi:hypothetical protein
MLAHIAGIPVEETALSFAPIAAVLASLAALRLRQLARLLPAHSARAVRHESAKGLQ